MLAQSIESSEIQTIVSFKNNLLLAIFAIQSSCKKECWTGQECSRLDEAVDQLSTLQHGSVVGVYRRNSVVSDFLLVARLISLQTYQFYRSCSHSRIPQASIPIQACLN